MITGLLAFCVAIMRCFPETTLARWLTSILVELPLAALASFKRHHIIFLMVVFAFLFLARDFPMLWSAGEFFALSLNLSIYLDAAIVAAAVSMGVAAVNAWRGIRGQLAMRLHAVARRRSGRTKRIHKPRTPPSADDEDQAWAVAFAA